MKKCVILFLGTLVVACNGLRSIKSVFTAESPYEQYVESLKKAGLANAVMTRAWLSAGERVLDDSVIVQAPFSESGFFPAAGAEARSYRFKARDGQMLTVEGDIRTEGKAKVFLDLFIRDGDQWDRISFADSTFSVKYEFTTDEDCVLRLQPELLANVYYAINISLTPVLINPVFGASDKSIGSLYGASRDDGKRLHEGVDIFARRGTPIVAPTDGDISRVGLNTLGGKVIWMKDRRRNQSYYFAHLDSQMVEPGMHVFQGYVLGLVGNTGNASKTAPHLHFGIYHEKSKDPLYYIHRAEQAGETLAADTCFNRDSFKVRREKIKLMTGPSASLPVKASLKKDTYVTVIGESNEWYRISLPDEKEGYILKEDLVPLSEGLVVNLDSSHVLFSKIREDAIPVAILRENTPVEILACFEDYQFVRTGKGKAGWLYY